MRLNNPTTVGDFRGSEPWECINTDTTPKINDNVLCATRIEKIIFGDLRERFPIGLDEVEADAAPKLDTFPGLIQDTFTSLYSINPCHNDTDTLTTNARQFNLPILDSIMDCDQYPTLKSLCESRDLVAYETVNVFARHMHEKLDELLNAEALEELNVLESQQSELKEKIRDAMEHNDPDGADTMLIMAESMADNDQQIERLSQKISRRMCVNKGAIQSAVASAAEKAQEVSDIIKLWGSDDSSPTAIQQNAELLRRMQSSKKMREIMKYLGRYRELLDKARKSSFAYGRGEKYDIVLGNDFTRAISSEYAYLSLPETVPLFIQKVQRRTLKQYRKRERISKKQGDIVVCIDESGSMTGDKIAWAKAVALVLLEYATQNNRSCAMVRHGGNRSAVTHIYKEGNHTIDDVFNFAESFLSGCEDFEVALKEAVEIIEGNDFQNADIMFITDGISFISEEFVSDFLAKSERLNFKVIGVLIDAGATMEDSISQFCEKVYRLSEMTSDKIATDIITSFVR